MRHLLLAFVLLCAAVPAGAQEPKIQGFEVIRFGVYTREVTSTTRDAKGILHNVVSHPRLALSTTTIPAKLGVTFGFEYKITGHPDDVVVTLRDETHYPAPGARPPGATKPILVDADSTSLTLNHVNYRGYSLQEPWELLPGKWVFEFWSGHRKLGSQVFTLVAQ